MTRSQIDLAEIARICIEQIRPLAKIRGIQFLCDLQPTEIFGNADRLAQVINNLLSNAIHYNKPNGEVAISTRIENASAILAVADTGQGISPEDLPQIFGRFYRADKSRARA